MDHPNLDVEVLPCSSLMPRWYFRADTRSILGDSACRGVYREALKQYLKEKLPGLCGDCQRRYETNPLRILDCKIDADKFGDSPIMLDHLCDPCKNHFQKVETGLTKLGIPFEINPRLVRWLDYYTRTTFELVMGHMGAQNTVAAGGRYDGLVKEIGGPPTPGIGFALGVERTVSLIDRSGLASSKPVLFIAALGEEALTAVPCYSCPEKEGIRSKLITPGRA
jgi:histidyl-tRNA synthetase